MDTNSYVVNSMGYMFREYSVEFWKLQTFILQFEGVLNAQYFLSFPFFPDNRLLKAQLICGSGYSSKNKYMLINLCLIELFYFHASHHTFYNAI